MPIRDLREGKRLQFSVSTEIVCQTKVFPGELIDISLKGALMSFPERPFMDIGIECTLRMFLPSSQITLLFESRLIHLKDEFCGFEFIKTDDVTLSHLRRILELNLGDEIEMEDELFFLLDSHDM